MSEVKNYVWDSVLGRWIPEPSLTAASAASDNFANPTTTNVMTMNMVYDGSTWDRLRGDSTNGALVNVSNPALIGPSNAVTFDSYTSAAISSVTGSNQQIIAAPGANKQIWVYGYQLCVTATGTVAFQDEDDVAHTGAMTLSTGISVSPSGNFLMPIMKIATNKALELDVVTATVSGSVQYAIVNV